MNKLLKDLYDCFYTPPELAATKREIEECHRALIEALGMRTPLCKISSTGEIEQRFRLN